MPRKRVEDFYPITTTKYPDGDESMPYILDSHLKDWTKPVEVDALQHDLMGQTRYPEGVYAHDVDRWMNNLPVID